MRGSQTYECKQCQKEFRDYISNKRVFCSTDCKSKYLSLNPNRGAFKKGHKFMGFKEFWFKKGRVPHNLNKTNGTITTYGYKKVMCKGHPRGDKDGYVFEHILVMEKYLGEPIPVNMAVHHINENKLDNRIENLYLFKTRGEHISFHKKLKMKGANG